MDTELIFVALLASLLFAGITGFYPGGIIVPSYLVLFINQPTRLLGTIAAALLTYACYKIASRYLIIFGKRMFVFMVLTGAVWTFCWIQFFPLLYPAALQFRVIGWVVPGLIANNFQRQGILPTSAGIVTVTVAVYLIGRIFGMVG
ncbi:MAG: poly-gamma-glutamate biosynthesis protein PgsC [Ignavibacteriales bacterium]|nr:poly-gamma-glutamate biosynthesis protein PgsC [Ignavibacteriales bacterium]